MSRWLAVPIVGLIVVGVLIGLIVTDIARHNRQRDHQFLASYGGSSGVGIIQNPEHVEAFRLAPIPREEQQKRWSDWTAYVPLNGPIELNSTQRSRVSQVLGSPGNLEYDVALGCLPSYEIRFRFTRGDESLDVLVCLSCHLFLVFRDGSCIGGGWIRSAPAARVILAICSSLWPDDADIQKLSAWELGH
jgi:hypothetical protein